ncbi:MAG: hypothetical protein WCG99_01550 [Candidatus Berkelbacteria bacterium]
MIHRCNKITVALATIPIVCSLFACFASHILAEDSTVYFDDPISAPTACMLPVTGNESSVTDEQIDAAETSSSNHDKVVALAATPAGTTVVDTTTNAGAGVGVGVSFPNGGTDNAIQSGTRYTYTEYISKMYGFAMKVAVALSILMVIYAGFKYMTSRGDSSSINEAKDILFSTLMGAALLMLVVLVGNIAGFKTSVWGI